MPIHSTQTRKRQKQNQLRTSSHNKTHKKEKKKRSEISPLGFSGITTLDAIILLVSNLLSIVEKKAPPRCSTKVLREAPSLSSLYKSQIFSKNYFYVSCFQNAMKKEGVKAERVRIYNTGWRDASSLSTVIFVRFE